MRRTKDNNVSSSGMPGTAGFLLDMGRAAEITKTDGQGAVFPAISAGQIPAPDAGGGLKNDPTFRNS